MRSYAARHATMYAMQKLIARLEADAPGRATLQPDDLETLRCELRDHTAVERTCKNFMKEINDEAFS